MSFPHISTQPMAEPQLGGTAEVELGHPDPLRLGPRIRAAGQAIRALLPVRVGRIQLAPDEETSGDGPPGKTARTSRAKICSIVTIVLVSILVIAITVLFIKYNRFDNDPSYYSTYPMREDGKASRCYQHCGDRTSHGGWRNSIHGDRNGIKRVASISTDLDTTGGLFFITRGSLASGTISYMSAKSASINVEVRYRDYSYKHPRDWEHNAAFSLCHLTREDNYGVGLYMPDKWDSEAGAAAYDVSITVSLPEARYKALESRMANMYNQRLSFSSGTHFGNVTLGVSSANINAESLQADHLSVRAEGWGGINGSFSAKNAAELVTEWGGIDADVTLGAHDVHEPQLRLQPRLGSLRSTVRMIESPRFVASVSGEAGPIDLKVASLPVDATLNLGMRSVSECPRLTLPATFEGTIFQQSGKDFRYRFWTSCVDRWSDLMPTLDVQVGDDPAALGRTHDVTTEFQMDQVRRDTVSWGGPTNGFVAVETGNGKAGVNIVKDWH